MLRRSRGCRVIQSRYASIDSNSELANALIASQANILFGSPYDEERYKKGISRSFRVTLQFLLSFAFSALSMRAAPRFEVV